MAVVVPVCAGAGLALLVSAGLWVGDGDRTPFPAAADEPASASDPVVDERRLLFREDEDPSRVVAEVTAALVRGADGVRLRVVASAVAPSVGPAPGYEGLAGSNRIAAEEMGALLRRDGLAIESSRRGGGGRLRGTVRETSRGRLLERSIGSRGGVEHVPSRGTLSLGAEFATPPLPNGLSTTEILADGRVRVRAIVRVREGRGRIVALEEVDGHSAPAGRP